MWHRRNRVSDAFDPRGKIDPWERVDGSPVPLGATWIEVEKAWNFAVYSRHATGVTLLLYGEEDFAQPAHQVDLHPIHNRTGRTWHCFVREQSAPGARYYAYKVKGPLELER